MALSSAVWLAPWPESRSVFLLPVGEFPAAFYQFGHRLDFCEGAQQR